MTPIKQLFENYKIESVKSRRTERGDLVSYFLENMNADRRKQGRKEWTIANVAYFLSIYSVEDLYHLRMKCDKAKNFCACLLWHLFPK